VAILGLDDGALRVGEEGGGEKGEKNGDGDGENRCPERGLGAEPFVTLPPRDPSSPPFPPNCYKPETLADGETDL